jgi:ERCC4-related helicase
MHMLFWPASQQLPDHVLCGPALAPPPSLQDIHGKQKQQRRTTTFFEFCSAEKGILLCTDVAARGLDIPGR